MPTRRSRRYAPVGTNHWFAFIDPPLTPCKSNYKLVWDEAVRVTLEIIDNVWMNREEVVSDHANDVTTAVRKRLSVIASARPNVSPTPLS